MMEKTWICIVDMDQPGVRNAVVFQEDEFDVSKFTLDEIRAMHKDHQLNVFPWWAFNFATGESVEI